MAAKAAIEAMGGKGNLVPLTGNKVDSNTQCRIVGVQKAVDEAGGKVILVQTITDIDLQSAQKAVADLLAARGKDVQGIVTTAYNPAVAAAAGSSGPAVGARRGGHGLWDRSCRVADLPLATIAGGAKKRIPLYNNEIGWLHYSVEDLVTGAPRRWWLGEIEA